MRLSITVTERKPRMIVDKRERRLAFIAGFAVAAFLLAGLMQAAAKGDERNKPDFTRGDEIPEGSTHDWNLGPTGARGWMYSDKMETSDARQVYITQVDDGSPAHGVLEKGDVILGIAGKPFFHDPRMEIGKAITESESGNGILSLSRWRKGKTDSVDLQLPILGSYGPTAPFGCAKSKRIFERGCGALAEKMKDDPEKGNPIERSLNALALLSSGKSEYLPLVRKQVEWASQYSDLERKTLHSWWYGYVNMLVAEYILATRDRTFMPDLKRITMEIVHGQSVVGSWGHRFVQPENGCLAGYGMMNAPGLPLTVSLILAREAGVSDPALDRAIEKSARLIRFYVGKGSVPYGDHHPWIDTHEDNGKNGIAALMFNLLGDAEAAEYFSRMSVASHGGERDTGHTGNFFNILWAMPGVSLSGPHAAGAWMKEFGWYYDLARCWDGTYLHQGPPAERPDSYKGWDCTGVYLLAYGLPLKKIHLTGKMSVAPQVDAAVAERLIADGRGWSPKHRIASYAERKDADIYADLGSWSPVVRERSAMELANRDGDPTTRLIEMLDAPSLYTRYGACQALIMLKKRAAPAVSALKETLAAEDLWLRIKAAEALAGIGSAAMSTVPDLLEMLAQQNPEADPRGMQQRYLCFALFNQRDGMLGRSLEGVDRESLYTAVSAGLGNEDGRARGSIASVYKNLSYEEIEPLLPAIHQAVIKPAPSGIMFADGIRLSGLEILAKHRIKEGLPLCVSLIDPGRWGLRNRIKRCLETLRVYGGAAKPQIPRIQELEKALLSKNWKPEEIKELGLPAIIKEITDDRDPPVLRSLNLSKAKDLEAGRGRKLQIFILAGQSNMEGQGVVSMDHPEHYNGGKGNLVWSMAHSASKEKMLHLKDANGQWVVRDDVEISFKARDAVRKGGLTVGYTGYGGSSHIGPELQFGNVMGDFFDEPVLLIKTAWGGKSLYKDFRPPSSEGEVGPYYSRMVQEVRDALKALGDEKYEIKGFVWMQGWNDMCTEPAVPEYAENLVNLAGDIRREFKTPELPIVIGELGNGGAAKPGSSMQKFRDAQKRGAENIDNALFVSTSDFARPPELSPNTGHGHHWFGNAESYFLVGNALGQAMKELVSGTNLQ